MSDNYFERVPDSKILLVFLRIFHIIDSPLYAAYNFLTLRRQISYGGILGTTIDG